MKRLLNQMRMQAQMAMSERASVKIGLVSGYDSTNYSVKVSLQPEDIETGWIPLVSPWVGNGWGMFCPPTIGDMIEVQFEQGGAEAAFACLRFYNDSDRPLNVPSGEFWLVHKLGAFLKLTNDGKLLINSQVEIDVTAPKLNVTISGDANMTVSGNITSSAAAWNHTGPMNIDGNVAITGDETVSGTMTATTDVIGGGKSLKTHHHSGGTIVGNTGAPL